MARYNINRYQYETSPRKIQPDYVPKQKQYPKKSTLSKKETKVKTKVKTAQKNNTKIVLCIGLVFAVLFAISYRNALIAQEYSGIKDLKSKLSVVEKENEQLEVNIESKTNLGTIEEKASKELGLKKLDKSQTIYVSLDKQDYIESSSEEVKLQEENNWFINIINKIKDIF